MVKLLDLRVCGLGSDVDLEGLEKIQTPPPQGKWFPIPHKDLVDEVTSTLVRGGLEVVGQRHLVAGDGGARYFGLLQVAGRDGGNDDDYGIVVGLRNSHDKSIVAGLAVGSGVFVCSNLAFSGEVEIARKHTRHVRRDLPGLVQGAVGRLTDLRKHQSIRIDAYKASALLDSTVHDILIRSLDARVVPVTKLPKVLEEWRKPSHEEFGGKRNAWRLFNAYTETLKDSSLFARPQATQALHGILDTVCGVK